MREASSLVLSARLQGEGARSSPTTRSPSGRAASCCRASSSRDVGRGGARGADAAILVTEWPEFAELDWAELAGRMANPLIVDGRNFLDPERMRAAGFTYEGIGRRLMQARRRSSAGEGTRLRPLTLTQPKPALPLVDRPFIRYMVDWLGRHGIDEVVMACGFKAEDLRAALGDEVPGGPSIRYVEEDEPLGTAGPVRLAADQGLLGDRFMVLNGDSLTDLDLTALQRQHAETGAVVTLGLYPVDDPTSYGLVRRDRRRRRPRLPREARPGRRSTPTRSTPAPT